MPAKRLLVLGATGPTGQHVVMQALARDFAVTALVRDPARLPGMSDRVRVLTGSVTEEGSALADAMRNQDAVISTLGVGKSFTSNSLMTLSVPRIMAAMRINGVRRLILTSAFGVGETKHRLPLLPKVFIRLLLQDIYRDKEAAERLVRESDLDWTIVYPSGLTNGPFTRRYRVGERLTLRGFPRIARADVADFLLSQVDDTTYVRRGVMLSA